MEQRRLVRRTDDKMIAGVAGGVADFFGLDPTIVRIVFVLLAVFGGGGLVLYLVMWVIVPKPADVALPGRDVARSNVDDMVDSARRAATEARKAVTRDRSTDPEPTVPPPPEPQKDAGQD